jgi:tRNA modification GTPase
MPSVQATHGEATIAAIITGAGGAVAVIRISGPDAIRIAAGIWQGRRSLAQPPWRELRLGACRDGETLLDPSVLAVFMPAPHSYTGEDVVEIHCHGGSVAASLVLNALLRHGCQPASAGEFTKRAFINGRMDLTQAEAVGDLILARSESALRLAGRQLDGLLGRRVNALYDLLVDRLAEIESRLDFPDEHLDFPDAGRVDADFAQAEAEVAQLLSSRREGEILRHGILVAIAGPPNVGKSSLMNLLLGRDRAIVTHIPGTTRDLIEDSLQIRGIPIRLTDTAGIRTTGDFIEQDGIRRSRNILQDARLILWVYEAGTPVAETFAELAGLAAPIILVANKADLLEGEPPVVPAAVAHLPRVLIAARSGQGLENLLDAIGKAVWHSETHDEPEIAVNARHAAGLELAANSLADARDRCATGEWELAAIGLRTAITEIGRITGRTADADLLDTIFARFCIGK